MKKKFILATFGVSLLFAACQQDSLYNDFATDDKNSSILGEMKTLISDNYNSVTLLDWERTLRGTGATRSGGNYRSLKLTKEDFGFDWDNADVMTSHLAEAVIVPVKLNKEIALRSVVMEGNKRKKETTPVQSMLYACKIYKTGKTRAYILSYAPDRDYINECEEKGEEMQLYPNPQGSNFSGILFYSTIYGEVSHGIRYENGRKRYYIVPRSEKNIGFIEQYRSEHCDDHECHNHVKMAMEFITVNTATRSTYSNNSEGAEMLICMFCGQNAEECTCLEIIACGKCKKDPCECEEIDDGEEEEKCVYCGFPIEYCQCNNNNYPSWGDDDYNNSHGPSPDPYPENKPGGNSGGSSDDDGTNISPIVKNIGEFHSTFNTAAKIKLDSVVSTWYNKNIHNKGIYSLFFENLDSAGKLIFKMNPSLYSAQYNHVTNTMSFFNLASIYYETFAEEFIHATQDYSFYTLNMSEMGKRAELEAKVIIDIISYLNKETDETYVLTQKLLDKNSSSNTIVIQEDYMDWIKGNNYSNYSEKFEEWLDYFNYRGTVTDSIKEYKMFEWFYENYLKK